MRLIGLSVVLTSVLTAAPLAAEAQQARTVPKIGIITYNAPPRSPTFPRPSFWNGMREFGWVEGQNLQAEIRGASGDWTQLPNLAAELVRLNVSVIVVDNGFAAKRVQTTTQSVPICAVGGDLQAIGAVNNLARPEANITGVQVLQIDLAGKRLALLKEIVPSLTRVGLLASKPRATAGLGTATALRRATEDASRTLGLELHFVELPSRPSDFNFDRTFSELTRVPLQGLLVMSLSTTQVHRDQIVALAAKARVPTIFEERDFAQAGALMSYGPLSSEMFRQLAGCVDKILRGAKPADVPVHQSTRFELVINLKTAKALGLTIPQSVLVWADEVIQ